MKIYSQFAKRFLDFVLSLCSIIILAPFLLLVTVLLFFANKGAGVFFFQERPGKNNRIFKVIKFKSMTDSCDSKGSLLPNEQRITKIGAIIRRFSIDELPQLINVMKGEMSLIGPRPLPIRYLELYNSEQIKRHLVLPGLTGWAQVNGRNMLTWSRKFELDVWYVEHISFWLDIKIFILTILKILKASDINSSSDKIGAVGFNGKN